MSTNIEYECETELNIPYEDIINKVINATLELEKNPYETEINVILTDNEEIKQINLEYREIDEPTDVISFPMVEFIEPSDFTLMEEELEKHPEHYFEPESGELIFGDIVISMDKVIEQADTYGHSIERELAFLVVHGMLHLFGYDHIESNERELMEDKQKRILDLLGFLR